MRKPMIPTPEKSSLPDEYKIEKPAEVMRVVICLIQTAQVVTRGGVPVSQHIHRCFTAWPISAS